MIKNPDSIRAGVVEALKEGNVYSFVIEHAYEMDRDDLARIIAELSYAVYSRNGEKESKAIESMAAESLENDYWDESDYE